MSCTIVIGKSLSQFTDKSEYVQHFSLKTQFLKNKKHEETYDATFWCEK